MSVHKGTIEAISHKYDKFAVLIEDKWYNTKKEYADEWPVKPTVGDVITFDDGGKKYLGKMKIVSSGSPAGAAKPSGGYSNIGVEVGHASNLAMRVMEQKQLDPADVGYSPYYREFVKETETIYKLMKALKAKLSEEPTTAVVPESKPEPEPESPKSEPEDLTDLF